MNLDQLEQKLNHTFKDISYLEQALTHQSGTGKTYERLEFLGDRVIGLVVAEMLLHHFPDEAEGEIAKRHTALVRRETMAEVARQIGVGAFMDISTGEEQAGTRENESVLADMMEAILAAIYLDAGMEKVKKTIQTYWLPLLQSYATPPQDPKTQLQEWAQARKKSLPVYDIVHQSGPDHAPDFTVKVIVEGFAPVTGTGKSKRAAEQDAAEKLLEKIHVKK